MRFVQIPTSLLAQVDSSVGGKTGINTPQGKNLIGVFHQPVLVIADTNVLTTLPERELNAGYAEVAKYGLLGDADFFGWLESNWRSVFGNDTAALTHAIETSVKAKAAIVERDEHETGDRALLNLGHTFGHALEAWTGYSTACCMAKAYRSACASPTACRKIWDYVPRGQRRARPEHLKAVGLPTSDRRISRAASADAAELVRLMGQDKKVRDGKLTFILVRDIGEAFVTQDVAPERVTAFLERHIRRAPA